MKELAVCAATAGLQRRTCCARRCHNSRLQGRRNVLNTWEATAATVGHGRRNAFAFANCHCRNSWLQVRRNVIAPPPLPQQLALGTPQRLDHLGLPLPQQSALNLPSRTLSTIHQDVRDLSATSAMLSRNSRQQGRRNVRTDKECRCRNSKLEGRRNVKDWAERQHKKSRLVHRPQLSRSSEPKVEQEQSQSSHGTVQYASLVESSWIAQHPCPRRIINVACLASDAKYARHCAKSVDSTDCSTTPSTQ